MGYEEGGLAKGLMEVEHLSPRQMVKQVRDVVAPKEWKALHRWRQP